MGVLETQLEFYKKRKAGCIFAAIVAKNPKKYSWYHCILNQVDNTEIDEVIGGAIADKDISTLSIIFPSVKSEVELLHFISIFEKCKKVTIGQDIVENSSRCIGFRVSVNKDLSWVSGFGNFDFLPKTRQTPYTEIVFRVKPRPFYEWYMKPPMIGVIHLADMDMLSASKRVFKKWWNASLVNTKKVLGHSPNLLSAAKTTFSIPIQLFHL